jgi:hypothetical protein
MAVLMFASVARQTACVWTWHWVSTTSDTRLLGKEPIAIVLTTPLKCSSPVFSCICFHGLEPGEMKWKIYLALLTLWEREGVSLMANYFSYSTSGKEIRPKKRSVSTSPLYLCSSLFNGCPRLLTVVKLGQWPVLASLLYPLMVVKVFLFLFFRHKFQQMTCFVVTILSVQ